MESFCLYLARGGKLFGLPAASINIISKFGSSRIAEKMRMNLAFVALVFYLEKKVK